MDRRGRIIPLSIRGKVSANVAAPPASTFHDTNMLVAAADSPGRSVLQLKYRIDAQTLWNIAVVNISPHTATVKDVKHEAGMIWDFPDKDKVKVYFRGHHLSDDIRCGYYGITYAMCLIVKYESTKNPETSRSDQDSIPKRYWQLPSATPIRLKQPGETGLQIVYPERVRKDQKIVTPSISKRKEREIQDVHDASAMWDVESVESVESEEDDSISSLISEMRAQPPTNRSGAIMQLARSFIGEAESSILQALDRRNIQRQKFVRNHARLLKSFCFDLQIQNLNLSAKQILKILCDVEARRLLSEQVWYLVKPWEQPDLTWHMRVRDKTQNVSLQMAIVSVMKDTAYTRYITRRQIFLEQKVSPLTLKNFAVAGALSAVEELLASDFDAVAQEEFAWLHELLDIGCQHHEMARVLVDGETLSPWIMIGSPIFSLTAPREYPLTDWHQMDCVHRGGRKTDVSPCVKAGSNGSLTLDAGTSSNDMRKVVNEICGIAGIVPFIDYVTQSHLPIDTVKFTGEKNSVAWISYGLHQEEDPISIANNILAILSQINSAVHFLQVVGFCCNSITIPRLEELSGVIELCRVPVSLILRFQTEFRNFVSDLSSLHYSQKCIDCVSEILSLAIGKFEADEYLRIRAFENTESLGESLHLSALAAQVLCVGVLSYSLAHVGQVHPSFLVDPLKEIHLLGTSHFDQRASHVVVELFDFTCIKDMLQESVLAFRLYDDNPARFSKSLESRQSHCERAKYDLLASAEDLVDTWGAARFIVNSSDPKTLVAIEIGGGTIMASDEHASKLHWSTGQTFTGVHQCGFQSNRKMVIAGSTINKECPLDEHKSWQHPMTHAYLQHLGTSNDSWVLREKQTGLQTGSYAVVQFNNTYVKQNGVTLKQRQLMLPFNEIDLAFLHSTCGLQVSFCTGVARRVALRELLADVMIPFVESKLSKPEHWESLKIKHQIVESFRTGDLEEWFNRLSISERETSIQIVRSMLDVLKDTGIDRNGEELVIAWVRKGSPYSCLRIRCEKMSLWTRILADSEDCATFACMTPLCLEMGDHKCRNLEIAPWHNASTVLDTAVCQHLSNRNIQAATSSQLVPWKLQHQVSYWIGKSGSNLIAKVWLSGEDTEPKLVIRQKVIPEKYRARLPKSVVDRLGKLRERQASEAIAKQVLVMTEI